MYEKFKKDLERQKVAEEEKVTADFAKAGFEMPPDQLYCEVVELHIGRIRELYEKRIEIDEKLILDKFGYFPDGEIEGLKTRVSNIINQEMERQKNRDYIGNKLKSGLMNYIETMRESFLSDGIRDVKIKTSLDQLRVEKEKRERFSFDYIEVLMEIFKLRDNANTHFKNRFGFGIFGLEQEGVIPEIIKPCKTENDFVTKIATLGNLVDWMFVDGFKSRIKAATKGDKSITLLEKFLKQEFGDFEGKLIKNLRVISELRNKKFPIHKEGEEVIDIFRDLGEKYPPGNWDAVWKKLLALYLESLKGLIGLF